MKCTIPALNIKVLGRAVHSLAKIGDELHIEPLKDGLSFRAVSSSRSAYAAFVFSTSFFSYYKCEEDDGPNGECDDIKCKIAMKSCLNVFRTSSSLDKNVETCQLRLDSSNENLIFELRCRYGIRKIHYLPIIECEVLQAVYTTDNVPNTLTADARVFVDAVNNFQNSQDEITFSVDAQSMTLSNYVENAPDPKKVIRTELSLNAGEFDKFLVAEKTSITFRLKELRAMLFFAENVHLPISVNFETTGRPVVFVVKANAFEANFVLATLADKDTQSTCSQVTSNFGKPAASLQKETKARPKSKKTSDTNKANSSVHGSKPSTVLSSNHTLKTTLPAPRQPDVSRRSDDIFTFRPTNDGSSTSRKKQPGELDGSSAIDKLSLTADLQEVNNEANEDVQEVNMEANEDIIVPRTPTPPLLKKARYIFKRCFEDTYIARRKPSYNEVLAEDSTEEHSAEDSA